MKTQDATVHPKGNDGLAYKELLSARPPMLPLPLIQELSALQPDDDNC